MKTIKMETELKSMLRALFFIIAFLWIATSLCAQENKKVTVNVAGDIVSSYVWRGQYQVGSSIQPTLGVGIKNFSLTAWGSVDFTGKGNKEADLTAAYTFRNITLTATDYWWAGEGKNKYFHLDNHTTDHIYEAGITYLMPYNRFPLSLSCYTMIGGGDKKANGKQAYSTYMEANYPFTVKDVSMNAFCGFTPCDAAMYQTRGFAMTNIGVKASKNLRLSDSFSLPIYTQVIWNPNKEDVHFVFGVTLK